MGQKGVWLNQLEESLSRQVNLGVVGMVGRQVSGQMNGWKEGWVDGCVVQLLEVQVCGWENSEVGGWMCRCTDRWVIDGWIDG